MKDLTVVSLQNGILLGLRFRDDGKLRIIGLVGSEALAEESTNVVHGFAPTDVVSQLPSEASLNGSEITRERAIHMVDDDRWVSEQTGPFLLHQNRPNLRCSTVSPLTALAALQLSVGDGISYLSKQREIFLNQGSIEISTVFAADRRSGFLCGPDAALHADAHKRLLGFSDMKIELENALRSELQGLGHLFALTVGAAMHLVNTADLHHTLNNS